ncbi:MAG: circularly permuted type 2 ATP-grasp protein, partial [Sphingobacteriia bacterium]|nr:circularly permuted type 2 ATP-grasp protein [Sphingobacteriia bacterium]
MLRQFQAVGASGPDARAERPAAAYHEFYRDDFQPREHYVPLWKHIQRAGQRGLALKAREAHLALHNEGVTFTLYSDQEPGVERVWPFDILPRLVTAGEWAPIEAGLKQRIRALDRFIHDVYHEQCILKDGVVPPELIYRGRDLCRDILDVDPPGGVYIHISGVDLIRDESGRYLV